MTSSPVDKLASSRVESFGKAFMPKRFRQNFSQELHAPMCSLYNDDSEKQVDIISARGVAKSTFNLLKLCQSVCYQRHKFIGYCSQTDKIAMTYTRQARNFLEFNPKVKNRFGDLRGSKWADDVFITSTGLKVVPLGVNQQITSSQAETEEGFRFDLLFLDDIQDRKRLRSETLRKSDMEWLLDSVIPAMEPGGRIIVTANAHFHTSMALDLANTPGWRSLHLPICNRAVVGDRWKEDGVSYWPERYPLEMLRAEFEQFRHLGHEASWYRQRLADPMPPANEQWFSEGDFIAYPEELDAQIQGHPAMMSFVTADVAKTKEEHSCDSVILGFTVDPNNKRVFLRRMEKGKMHPAIFMDRMFGMASELGAIAVCPEESGLELWLRHDCESYISAHRLPFEYHPVKAGKRKKDDRFQEVIPYFKNRFIFIHTKIFPDVKISLLSYATGIGKKDLGDAVANIPKVLMDYNLLFDVGTFDVEYATRDPKKIVEELEIDDSEEFDERDLQMELDNMKSLYEQDKKDKVFARGGLFNRPLWTA